MSREHIHIVLKQAEKYIQEVEQKYKKNGKNINNTIAYLRIYPLIMNVMSIIKDIRSCISSKKYSAIQKLSEELIHNLQRIELEDRLSQKYKSIKSVIKSQRMSQQMNVPIIL